MTGRRSLPKPGHDVIEATDRQVPVVAMSGLNHLQVHMVASGLNVAPLLVSEPYFSCPALDHCVVVSQTVEAKECGKTGISYDGCLVG